MPHRRFRRRQAPRVQIPSSRMSGRPVHPVPDLIQVLFFRSDSNPRASPHPPPARPYWPSPSDRPPTPPASRYRTAFLAASAPHPVPPGTYRLTKRTSHGCPGPFAPPRLQRDRRCYEPVRQRTSPPALLWRARMGDLFSRFAPSSCRHKRSCVIRSPSANRWPPGISTTKSRRPHGWSARRFRAMLPGLGDPPEPVAVRWRGRRR